MSLKDEILRSVVIHYIEDETPIGSVQLQKDYEMHISSATIRNHFKRLVLEGMLEQLHSSSGRIPTNDALVAFWIHELKSNLIIKIDSLKKIEEVAKRYGIFVILHKDQNNTLLSVVTHNKEYIILKFENCNILIKYSNIVERFLKEFVALGFKELLKLSLQMGVSELSNALVSYVRDSESTNLNKQVLINIAHNDSTWADKYFDNYANGDIVFFLKDGVNINNTVPNGCIVAKHDCKIGNDVFVMTYLGESSKNFRGFLSSLQI